MTSPRDPRETREDDVLIWTFDGSERINSTFPSAMHAWLDCLASAQSDPTVAAVVTAATGVAWNAGADLELLLHHHGPDGGGLEGLSWDLLGESLPASAAQSRADAAWDLLGLNHLAAFLRDFPKPLIAAIDGAVAGGGYPLALLHDIRVIGPKATFRTSFAHLGLASELGLGYLLPRLVGAGRATELMLTGRVVNADEAHSIGLATLSAPGRTAAEDALTLARSVAQAPTSATKAVRAMLQAGAQLGWTDYLEAEWAQQRLLFDTLEARASVRQTARRLGVEGNRSPENDA